MLIYDKAYTEIKNKYIIPLRKITVQYKSLNNINIKEFLKSKWTKVDEISSGVYLFHFEENDLLKGLLGDIELFYIRQMIQKNDVEAISKNEISANWDIVSNYYNAFFTASLFLRLCYRGNIFLDDSIKKEIEFLMSQVLGKVIKLDSNQFFEVIKQDDEYVLKLRSSGKVNTHELVWVEMDKLLDELILLSRSNSEERQILNTLKKANANLINTYPSKLRNRVNYQPIYGVHYLEKRLVVINSNISWPNTILGFTNTKDDNQIANMMVAYTKYIDVFSQNMIAEYYQIKGNQNGVLKKLNENRTRKIENYEVCYSFS